MKLVSTVPVAMRNRHQLYAHRADIALTRPVNQFPATQEHMPQVLATRIRQPAVHVQGLGIVVSLEPFKLMEAVCYSRYIAALKDFRRNNFSFFSRYLRCWLSLYWRCEYPETREWRWGTHMWRWHVLCVWYTHRRTML